MLWRTRTRRRMILHLALDRRHTGRLRKRDNYCGRGVVGVGKEPNHSTARKPVTPKYLEYFIPDTPFKLRYGKNLWI
jgi:hypothetical protein